MDGSLLSQQCVFEIPPAMEQFFLIWSTANIYEIMKAESSYFLLWAGLFCSSSIKFFFFMTFWAYYFFTCMYEEAHLV